MDSLKVKKNNLLRGYLLNKVDVISKQLTNTTIKHTAPIAISFNSFDIIYSFN